MKFHKQGTVMKNSIKVILMAIVVSANAYAQDQGHLSVKTVVQKEEMTINDAGETETRLVDVGTVVPGERIVYTITFQNIGAEPADNVVITNPIADNLTFVDGTAFGPGTVISFSIDGGSSYADRTDLTVIEDGVARVAAADDLTDIRWVMQTELAVGAQGVARFTALLN
jgi:uncharacterized repeat protein (TIGR01451 family)